MAKQNPYKVGDEVLASRAQDGANHEEGKVVDAYSLLIAGDEILMVVVEFPDEKRVWLKAEGADVMPKPVPEEDEVEGDAGEADIGDLDLGEDEGDG